MSVSSASEIADDGFRKSSRYTIDGNPMLITHLAEYSLSDSHASDSGRLCGCLSVLDPMDTLDKCPTR